MNYDSEYIDIKTLFENNESFIVFLQCIRLLNGSKLKQDDILIESCKNILSKIDQSDDSLLLPFALSLKCNANLDIMIEGKKILKYIDEYELNNKLNNNPLINSMILMILLTNKYIKSNDNKLLIDKDIYNNSILSNYSDDMFEILDSKYLSKLLTMLDIRKSEYLILHSLSEIIRDHSLSINKSIISEINTYENIKEYYNLCLNYYNYNSFKLLIKHGKIPSYYHVNDILIYYDYLIKNNKNDIKIYILEQFIRLLIENNYCFDPYQLNYLPDSFLTEVKKDIERIHLNIENNRDNEDNENNDNLLLLSNLLFIDNDKGNLYIMEELKNIDRQRKVKASIKASLIRLNYSVDKTFEYNRTDFEINMKYHDIDSRFKNEYTNDLDICYYTDENEIEWVFTNELFEYIYYERKNPYTNKLINDENILNSIKNKRNKLKRLGIPVDCLNSPPYKSISSLLSINYDHTQSLRQSFFNLAKLYNVNPYEIESLTIDNIDYLLKKLKISDIYIKNLHKDHAHLTFYRITYELFKENDDIIPSFFTILKSIIS